MKVGKNLKPMLTMKHVPGLKLLASLAAAQPNQGELLKATDYIRKLVEYLESDVYALRQAKIMARKKPYISRRARKGSPP